MTVKPYSRAVVIRLLRPGKLLPFISLSWYSAVLYEPSFPG
jgi:hypothetical protein